MNFSIAKLDQQFERQSKLQEMWKEKKKELDESRATFLSALREGNKEKTTEGIIAKLRSGRRLSPSELRYLQEYDPDLYQKAIEIMEEQKSYERALKQCKTQEEAQRLLSIKMSQLTAYVKAFPDEGEIRMSGIQSIHDKFTQTSEYASLPANKRQEKEDCYSDDKSTAYASGFSAKA